MPADPSSAAFPLVAALIAPGSDVILEGVMTESAARRPDRRRLREMGADIDRLQRRDEGGEQVADLRVRDGPLKGVEVPAARAPSMIDEYPGAGRRCRLRRGNDGDARAGGVAREGKRPARRHGRRCCARTASSVEIEGDDLIVHGRAARAGGGLVATHMDHRIAMASLVMGLASEKPVQGR